MQLVEERAALGLGNVSVMVRPASPAADGAPLVHECLQPLSVSAPIQVRLHCLSANMCSHYPQSLHPVCLDSVPAAASEACQHHLPGHQHTAA